MQSRFRLIRNKKLSIAVFAALALVIGGLATLLAARLVIFNRAGGKTFDRLADIPANHAGLVLGCSRLARNGAANLFFEYRMDAAAELFHAGKVGYLLVSGDNRRANYNEPRAMKQALIRRGVPAEKIVCDFAGLSTFDSIVRARRVFREEALTVVSQQFHNQRAIYIAEHHGIRAVGYNAHNVAGGGGRTAIRECFARVKTILDVKLLNKQPRIPDTPSPISENRSADLRPNSI